MPPSRRSAARPLQLLRVRISVFCLCLAAWPLFSEAARQRCGTELLGDLIFVCRGRGIYLGKGSWSGYGPRPRGKGIVDLCCKSSGCDLHHLEMYCAKPKANTSTTAFPSTSPPAATEEMFQAVFHKRLLVTVGAPGSPKREAKRRRSSQRKRNATSSRRRTKHRSATVQPPSVSGSTV